MMVGVGVGVGVGGDAVSTSKAIYTTCRKSLTDTKWVLQIYSTLGLHMSILLPTTGTLCPTLIRTSGKGYLNV